MIDERRKSKLFGENSCKNKEERIKTAENISFISLILLLSLLCLNFIENKFTTFYVMEIRNFILDTRK